MENSINVPQKIKNRESPDDPAIPLMGIYSKETKQLCSTLFTAALFTRAKTQKQPKCPWRDEF